MPSLIFSRSSPHALSRSSLTIEETPSAQLTTCSATLLCCAWHPTREPADDAKHTIDLSDLLLRALSKHWALGHLLREGKSNASESEQETQKQSQRLHTVSSSGCLPLGRGGCDTGALMISEDEVPR
eukprot:3699197-Amphidinium_carterae.1